MNYVLEIAYDGSSFWGWQKIHQGPTIEGTLQQVLEQILQESVTLQAASRTDRGVHADALIVNFLSNKSLDISNINALLPDTIRVLSLKEAPCHFHPTLHAEKKEYHYKVSLGDVQLPKNRLYSWHVPHQLDFEKMERASRFFLGEHDFSSFCNFRKNLNYKDKCRRIESLILKREDDFLLFSITGNNFLYKMVRNIVGTLIYVGLGKISPEEIPSIISAKKRSHAGITAPAHGLTLKKIYYPQEFNLGL